MKQWLTAVTVVIASVMMMACGTTSRGTDVNATAGQSETGITATDDITATVEADGQASDTSLSAGDTPLDTLSLVTVDDLEPYTVEVLAITSARLRTGPGTQYAQVGSLPRDKTSFASHKTPGGWILLTKDDEPYAYVWHKLVSVISVYE